MGPLHQNLMIEESETEKETIESDLEGDDNTCKEIVCFVLHVDSSKSYMLYYFDISS